MKVILGIGNPGREYEGTRHNLGFMVVDECARRVSAACTRRRFSSLVGGTSFGGERLLLLKPLTYVNESGSAARQALDWHKCSSEEILVVCDDVNLELGKIRVRARGSSGGHGGLASIATALDTQEFPRLRIGIGPADGVRLRDFVLSPFREDERDRVARVVPLAAEVVETWVRAGIDVCMNRYNQKQEDV